MMHTDDRELEDAIRSALRDRAAQIDPVAGTLGEQTTIATRPSRRTPIAVVAGLLLVATAMIGVMWWTGRQEQPTSRVSSGPVVDGRVNIPLRQERLTPELREVVESQFQELDADRDPLVVRPEGHDQLLVIARSRISPPFSSPQAPTMEGCIAAVTSNSTGYYLPSSSCFQFGAPEPPPGLPRLSALDMHVDAGDQRSYYAWVDVPEGATRVTYDSPALHAWQAPIRGVAVFPVPVDEGPTLRAFGADGRLLAEHVIEAPEFPSAGYVGPNPAWYDLDATMRFCARAPIDQVDFVVGGDRGRFRMFDGDGGIADVDAREWCTQMMELRPEPQSDIHWTYDVSNGAIQITYYRLIDLAAPDAEANRRIVPDAELRELNRARRAEVTPICKRDDKASWKVPACQIGA